METKNCTHTSFKSSVNVFRLTDGDNGPVKGYTADIRIECAECGVNFEFIGLPNGVSPSYPTVSIEGTELRSPIIPSTQKVMRIPNKVYN